MSLKSFNPISLFIILVMTGHLKAGASAEAVLLASNAARSVKVYAAPFSGFIPKIAVSACYSRFENDYLLLQRSNTIKDLPNIWGVPGGKAHAEETKEQANAREFFEETGIHLSPSKTIFFRTIYIRDPFKDFVFHMFIHKFSRRPAIKLNPKEHQAFAWLPYKEAVQIPLIPGELECFALLQQRVVLPLV